MSTELSGTQVLRRAYDEDKKALRKVGTEEVQSMNQKTHALQQDILVQLKIMNKHLQCITDEIFDDQDKGLRGE